MNAFPCEHTFKTTINVSKFEALVAKACRAAYAIELIAHDPGMFPATRLFTVNFSTAEDRDRMRIAMRFVEKEQADMAQQAPRTKTAVPPITPALATA